MTSEIVLDIFREGIFLAVSMVSVIILPGLFVGLIISAFQAATQINEQTLSFLPRLLATLFAVSIAAPWLSSEIVSFAKRLFNEIPHLIG